MLAVTLPSKAAANPMAFASRAKAAGADLLEIRGDITPDVESFEPPLPLIVAPRRKKCALLEKGQPMFIDLELGEQSPIPTGTQLIRSFHDHEGTPKPQELRRIVDRCINEGAEIIKIATTINSYKDLHVLDELAEALPREQKRIILGMGTRAHCNRMLSPFRNECTYTYLEDEEASASGQISLSLYRKTAHCKQPRLFGILGGLEVQTGSPNIHNSLFQRHGIDALFTTFLSDDLEDVFHYIKGKNVSGLSVTTPFKEKIIDLIDEIDPLAAKLQSVNTVVLENGKYKGYNTDKDGFKDAYNFVTNASSVAILGSGGAVSSLIQACKERGISDITIFARNKKARESHAHRFSVSSDELNAIAQAKPDVLICAISTDETLPIPRAKRGAHALDLRYGKKTLFMKNAESKGYQIHDGLPMLLHQALAQFRYFTDLTLTDSDFQMLLSLFPHPYGTQ